MTKVVLITVDSLRYDVLQDPSIETPNIDTLISKSISYERAFSNGYATAPAFPAILYSSTKNEGERPPESPSIADYFRKIGFNTIGITSNPYLSTYFNYDSGFDVYKDFVRPTREKQETSRIFSTLKTIIGKSDTLYGFIRQWKTIQNPPYKRAEVINREVLDSLEEGRDQFIWAHYMDTHSPFSPPRYYGKKYCPEAFRKRGFLMEKFYSGEVSDSDIRHILSLYKTELIYLDHELGKLFDYLFSLDEDLIMVFTSDHGEEFGERGNFGHQQYFEFNIHIPLSFYFPSKPGTKKDDIASHLDILPTVLSDFDVGCDTCKGINLLEESRDSLSIVTSDAEVVLTEKWKLIEHENGSYLFDISESLSEDENLYDKRPDVIKELNKLISPDMDYIDI